MEPALKSYGKGDCSDSKYLGTEYVHMYVIHLLSFGGTEE